MEIALEKQKQIVQDKFMKRAEEMADQMYHLALMLVQTKSNSKPLKTC